MGPVLQKFRAVKGAGIVAVSKICALTYEGSPIFLRTSHAIQDSGSTYKAGRHFLMNPFFGFGRKSVCILLVNSLVTGNVANKWKDIYIIIIHQKAPQRLQF